MRLLPFSILVSWLLLPSAAAGLLGCGGKVVFVAEGASGGAGGGSSSSSSTTSSSSSASSSASSSGAPGTVAENCVAYCAHLVAQSCDSGMCSQTCNGAYANAGACAPAYASWLACTVSHLDELACGTLPPSCEALFNAYTACFG
jgi:hypothetical protein